jgi:hypothetical protein
MTISGVRKPRVRSLYDFVCYDGSLTFLKRLRLLNDPAEGLLSGEVCFSGTRALGNDHIIRNTKLFRKIANEL